MAGMSKQAFYEIEELQESYRLLNDNFLRLMQIAEAERALADQLAIALVNHASDLISRELALAAYKAARREQ
jgi:hypothetical protein